MRATASKPVKAKANAFKNQFGTVKPYTRHNSTCPAEDDHCSCPKWLYVRKRGERDVRYALSTPSWAEALEKAADKLKALDPEIAQIREERFKQERERKTVYEAINLWLDRTRTLFGDRSGILAQYRSTFGWVDKDGVKRGALLRYATEQQIEYIDGFTPLVCQQWLDSKSFPGQAAYSRHQRWGTVRSFFKYLTDLGVLATNPTQNIKAPSPGVAFAHSPYTDAQYKSILEQADWYVDERVRNGERDVYCTRMHTFIELLRWTGMDVIDAVQFHADQIEDTTIDGSIVPVLRYIRTKTGIEAVIPLEPEVAQSFRSISMAPKSSAGLPFRYQDNDIRSDVHNWSRRIQKLFSLADIKRIPLTKRDGRPALDSYGNQLTTNPDAKMFRHTFAVGELLKGVPEEVVAKMLGHVGTDMLRRHYAPWCKARDEAHIRIVIVSRAKTSKKGR